MEAESTQHAKRPEDVLLDVPEVVGSHHGNSYFEDLLSLHSQDFADCCTQRAEREIASCIWSKVVDGRKGRFLVSSSVPNKYDILDKASVVSKICKVMSDLTPSAPRLALRQVRLLQQEVTTIKEERRKLRQDLYLMRQDCAVFQREIIALKHSCADLSRDLAELQGIPRSCELRLSRNVHMSSGSSRLNANLKEESDQQAFSRMHEPPLPTQVSSRGLKRKARDGSEDKRLDS